MRLWKITLFSMILCCGICGGAEKTVLPPAIDSNRDGVADWIEDVWIIAEAFNADSEAEYAAAGFQAKQFRVMDYGGVRYRSDRGARYQDGLPFGDDYTQYHVNNIRKNGLVPQGYLIPYRSEWAEKYPDMQMLDWNGTPINDHGPCLDFASPWMNELTQRIAEINRKYQIKMFWVDGYTYQAWGGVRGKYVAEAFKKDTGLDLPEKWDYTDPVFNRWLVWRGEMMADRIIQMQNELKKQDPETVLIYNALRFHAWPWEQVWGYEAVERAFDVDCMEYTPWVGNDPIHKRFMVARLRGINGTRHAYSWIYPNQHWGDQPAPLSEALSRIYTCLTQRIAIAFQPDAVDLKTFEVLNGEIKKRIPFLKRAEDVKHTALIATENNDIFFGTTPRYGNYRKNTEGMFRMLNELHLPLDVLSERDLTPERLKEYSVVVLPGQHLLSDASIKVLRDYVADGGGLIATDLTSRFDEMRRDRTVFGLQDVFGVAWVEDGGLDFTGDASAQRTYMEYDRSNPLFTGPALAHFNVFQTIGKGRNAKLNPETGFTDDFGIPPLTCDALAMIHQKYFLWNTKPVGDNVSVAAWLLNADRKRTLPMAYLNTYGKGKAAYFPMSLGDMYNRSSYPQWLYLLRNAVDAVQAAPPQMTLEAPMGVQFEPTWQPAEKRYVVHLLNDYMQNLADPDEPMRVRTDTPALADIVLKVHGREVKEAYAQPQNEKLVCSFDGKDTSIRLPVLRDHAMIVFSDSK